MANKMKILTIVGARPQFVKAAMVSREIEKYPVLKEIVVHTGQHFDTNMSQLFFEEMNIPKPKYALGIHSLPHEVMVTKMQKQIEEVAILEKPDTILVYGDTDSTLAGALAAESLHVRLCHIEAGLRSRNMHMREEYNA